MRHYMYAQFIYVYIKYIDYAHIITSCFSAQEICVNNRYAPRRFTAFRPNQQRLPIFLKATEGELYPEHRSLPGLPMNPP